MESETSKIEAAVKSAEYAFLVIRQKDGRFAIAHVENDETERQPTLDDVMMALLVLRTDLERQAVATAVVQHLQQVGAGQQASNEVVAEKKFVKRT